MTASLVVSATTTGSLTANQTAEFDPQTGSASLELSLSGDGHYAIALSIESTPKHYFLETSTRVEVITDANVEAILIEKIVPVELTFDEEYDLVRNNKDAFIVAMLNGFDLPDDVIVDDVELYAGM